MGSFLDVGPSLPRSDVAVAGGAVGAHAGGDGGAGAPSPERRSGVLSTAVERGGVGVGVMGGDG